MARSDFGMNESKIKLVISHIPYGKENAKHAETLSRLVGVNDRAIRYAVQEINRAGDAFIVGDKDGYYMTDDTDDLLRYYRKERSKAVSKLKTLKLIRRTLKDRGCEL